MLGESAPVRLRLLVTQATAADAAGSLLEFSDSLAYFERPNPEAILRSLHARALVAAPLADRPAVPELTVVDNAPTPPAPSRAPVGRRRWKWAAAAIVLVAAAGVFVRAKSRDGRVAVAIAGLKDSIAAAIETKEVTGTNVVETGDQEVAKRTAASRSQDAQTRARGVAPASSPGTQTVSTLGAPVPDMLPGPDLSAALVPLEAALPRPSEPVTDASEDRSQIYSRIDPSVVPARQVYPVLPATPAPGIRVEDLTLLDLVISPEGAVEQVRMRTTPRNVREFMLVSAAKAWRFQPATLDGRPVRFRHSVAITN
jgi:hypothetical protein